MGNSNDDPVYVAISQLGAQVRACEASVSEVHKQLADTREKASNAATLAREASRECVRVREERTGYGETKAAAKNVEATALGLAHRVSKLEHYVGNAHDGVENTRASTGSLLARVMNLEEDTSDDSSPDEEEETPVDTAAELLRRAIKRIPQRHEQLIGDIEAWLEENEGAQ